jgi:hypothetical protein
MKQLLLAFLHIVLFTNLFGQKTEIENLVNQAYKEVVPNNYEYYNLVDSSFVTYVDEYCFGPDELYSLLKNYPNFPVDSFIQKSKDCMILNWKNYSLIKAKISQYASIPKIQSQSKIIRLVPFNTSDQSIDSLKKTNKFIEMVTPVKKHWSKNRLNKEIAKAWAKYYNSIKAEDRIYYRFSTPLIFNNYAIITMDAPLEGATYIFLKVNNVWKNIFILNRWGV